MYRVIGGEGKKSWGKLRKRRIKSRRKMRREEQEQEQEQEQD
jgi:hypothetical protein